MQIMPTNNNRKAEPNSRIEVFPKKRGDIGSCFLAFFSFPPKKENKEQRTTPCLPAYISNNIPCLLWVSCAGFILFFAAPCLSVLQSNIRVRAGETITGRTSPRMRRLFFFSQ